MTQTSRGHHYVPQFYLAGFTPSARKNDHLVILDGRERSRFVTTPANVAHERDFYAIESASQPLDAFEKALAQFESRVGPVISAIHDSLRLPDDDDEFAFLLNFIAFMAVRTPRIRMWYTNRAKEFHVSHAKKLFSSPERIREVARKHPECGVDPEDHARIQALQKFAETHEMKISVPQNYHLEQLLKFHGWMLPYFFKRRWNIHVARPNAGDFICSDHPVGLIWNKPVRSSLPPRLDEKNTSIIFPLSKRLCLIGDSDATEEGAAFLVDTRHVARANTAILQCTYRFVFSAKSAFPWFKSRRLLGDEHEILDRVHRHFLATDELIRNPTEPGSAT